MIKAISQVISYIIMAVLFLVANLIVTYAQIDLETVEYRRFRQLERSVLNTNNDRFEVDIFDFPSFQTPTPTVDFISEADVFFLSAFMPLSAPASVRSLDTTGSQSFSSLLRPYFYPNPWRLSEGSTLGYELPDNMDIQLRIYTMAGHEIFREDYAAGTMGGLGHQEHTAYNKIPFDRGSFGGERLPAGIYFFILIHDQKVVAKGKFAIRPG